MSKIDARLGRELASFYALVLMNIVVGAVIMAFSISYGVQSIMALISTLSVIALLQTLPMVAMALAAFAIAIWWLIKSAEIFSEADEIRDEFGRRDTDEGVGTTSVIVRTMALYRERKVTISRMILVSRLAGILLLGIGAYSLGSLVLQGALADSPLALGSIAINFGIALVALYVPHIFSIFSRSWEERLAKGEEVEAKLRGVVEGRS